MNLVDIPLPTGFKALKAYPRQRERLLNLFFGDGGVLDTPGIEQIGEGVGPIRAAFEFQDQFYHVSGTSLIRVDQSGETLVIGTIPGSGQLSVAVNFTHAVIVGAATAESGYEYDGTTLSELDSAQYVPAVAVEEIDAQFVYIPADGGPAFFSGPNDPNDIQASYFFDAESLPDRNLEVIRIRDVLYILGGNSIEAFRNVGELPAPFLRINGGALPVGYISALIRWGDGFSFIGREQGQGFYVYIVKDGLKKDISNSAVNELLNQDYTEAELVDARGERYQWNGLDVLVFHLKRHTICYHNGEWFFQQSGVTGYTDSAPWRARWIFNWRGYYWCGDEEDGRIGRLVETDTEYDEPIQRVLETYFRTNQRESHFSLSAMDLDIVAARGGEGRVGLALSRDARLYGPTMWRDVPKGYADRLTFNYPGGLGSFPSHAGIRLSLTDQAKFATDSLTVEVG